MTIYLHDKQGQIKDLTSKVLPCLKTGKRNDDPKVADLVTDFLLNTSYL